MDRHFNVSRGLSATSRTGLAPSAQRLRISGANAHTLMLPDFETLSRALASAACAELGGALRVGAHASSFVTTIK